MAAPTLQGSTAIIGTGTSIAISASATSPVNGDLRVLVVHTSDRHTNGQPTTVGTPSGWTLIHTSPRGRSTVRTWVFVQKWTPSSPSGSCTLSSNLYYAATIARVSGYTVIGTHPIVSGPAPDYGTGSQLAGPSILTQADSLRLDFWTGFYATGANSGSTNITVPSGQTGSTMYRSATTMGYVTRVTSDVASAAGLTGLRLGGYSPAASVSAVLSLSVGGWKELTKASIGPLSLASSTTATKAVSRATASSMGLAASGVGSGRSTSTETTTTLGLDSASQRVYLTSTALGLEASSVGTHDSVAQSVDEIGLDPFVTGTHTAGSVDTTTTLDVTSTAVARVGGGGAPPSVVDQFVYEYQPSAKPLRFMFQRIRDGRWLNWDVALIDPEITWTLSGPTMIRGRIGPEDVDVIQGIDAWGTWLHVEESGLIRASAIMQPLGTQGDDLVIEAAGVHGYANGLQFESEFSAIQIDAAEAMRQLWAYLQSYPDARLGLTLDSTNTGRKLGEPEKIEVKIDTEGNIVYRELRLEEAYGGLFRVDQGDVPDSAWQKLLFWGYPLYQDTTNGRLVLLVTPSDYAMSTTGHPVKSEVTEETDGSITVKWFVPDYDFVQAKPYEIAWWNEIDVGREIENLAKQTPFDFAEVPRWTENRLDVQQHIAIGYPRLGTKRFDLRFAEDENLFAAVLVRESPGFYASQIIVRGAGEGRASVRAQVGGNNPNRLRRVTSLTDKTITTRERAAALGVEELTRRLAAYTISEITIDATHDNAPMGSFTVGDDILVQADLPYYGEVQLWHRILSYTWRPDRNEVVLNLRRSEQFVYGRVLTV